MVQFLRKVSDSEQKQKEQLIQKINCSECDSFQLYQVAELCQRLYGDSILSLKHKIGNYGDLQCRKRVVLRRISVLGHTSQTFHREASKNI